MLQHFQKILDQYNFNLPSELIAQIPAHPRVAAKLLVYDRASGKAEFDTFKNIAEYLPEKAVLVFNQTKVLPARLALEKEGGGVVKILYVSTQGQAIKALANKSCGIGSRLTLNAKLFFIVRDKKNGEYILEPSFPVADIYDVLTRHGETPIPPYIKNSPLKEADLRKEYQTVFAKEKGSVAAPTAALHFTKSLLVRLRHAGFAIKFITLHVNLGTFAPLKEENIKTGRLHREFFEIDSSTAAFLNEAKKEGRMIVAVGTTAARALESASNSGGVLGAASGSTDLFIREGYKFKFIDALITNFHVPQSSLLMLASAFIGSREKLLALYAQAIKNRLRFFSFGDGMLIN